MGERQAIGGLQDRKLPEHVRCLRSLGGRQIGELRDLRQAGAVTRARPERARTRSPRAASCASRTTIARATADGPICRTRSAPSVSVPKSRSTASRRSDSSRNGLPPVASRHAAENSADTPSPSLRSHSRRRRLGAERGRPQHLRLGRRRHAAHLGGVSLAGPRARQDRQCQPVQSRREEGEEAQRLGVRPVQVVDAQQDRRVLGDVVQQPVEGVQHGEGVVGGGRSGAGGREQIARQPGGAGEDPRRAPRPRAALRGARAAGGRSRRRSRARGRWPGRAFP